MKPKITSVTDQTRSDGRSGSNCNESFRRSWGRESKIGTVVRSAALALYPILFFLPALRPNSWSRIGDSNADLDHAVFEVIGLKSMTFPWSKNVALDYPFGENFWAIPSHVTQGVQWLGMWMLARVVDPMLAVELWQFIGFLSTGFVTYLIARELSISYSLAVFASLLVQALPWMTVKAMHHTSFVFLSIPLLVVLGILKLKEPSKQILVLLLIYQVSLAFFDSYWFVFSGILLFFGFIFQRTSIMVVLRSLSGVQRVRALIVSALSVGLLVFVVRWGLDAINRGAPTRPPNLREVFDSAEIRKWSGNLSDYFVPSHGHLVYSNGSYGAGESDRVFYGGLVVQILALGGLVFSIAIARSRQILILSTFVGICVLLSVYSIPLGFIEIPSPVRWLSRVTPGIRVYARFSPIAQALMCVIATWFVQNLWTRFKARNLRLILLLMIVGAVLDLGPFAYRPVFTEYSKYSEIREILASDPDATVLIPDGTLSPFELSMETLPAALNARLLNTYSNLWKVDSYPYMFESAALARFLETRQVSYVVATVNDSGDGFVAGEIQDATRFSTILDSADFDRVSSVLEAQNGFRLALFKVRGSRTGLECGNCQLAQWLIDPQPLVESTFEYGQEVNNPLWVTFPIASLQAEPIPDGKVHTAESYLIDFGIRLYPGSGDTLISIESEGQSSSYMLRSGEVRHVQVVIGSSDRVTITVPKCYVPSQGDSASTNSNSYCFGISGFRVLQTSQGS